MKARTASKTKDSQSKKIARRWLKFGVRETLIISALLGALVLWWAPTDKEMVTRAAEPRADASAPSQVKPMGLDVLDPFAGDTWHAIDPSWPGTLRFDAASKSVSLEPFGADPIEATYQFSPELVSNEAGQLIREGTLTMRASTGQLSVARYRVEDGKRLYLQFSAGQRPETYIKLSATEAEAEKQRLQRLFESGALKLPGFSPELVLP